MNDNTVVLQQLLTRPVAYHPVLASALRSVTAAVMLSQALYWTQRLPESRGGWFYKTAEEWQEETGLTRREQETARKKLFKSGILEEVRKGVPCKVHYKVDICAVEKVLKNPQFAQKRQTRFDKSAKLDSTNPPNKNGGSGETTHRLPGNTHTPPPPGSEPDSKGGGNSEIDEYLAYCKQQAERKGVEDVAGWMLGARRRIEKQGGLSDIDRQQLKQWRAADHQGEGKDSDKAERIRASLAQQQEV